MAFQVLFALFTVLIVLVLEKTKTVDKKWSLERSRWRLPPGPRGLPVVGNMFQLFNARDKGQLVPYLLSLRSFGDMTTLRMGSQLWIVLNTERAITDILMKRSKATNERPDMPIASSLVSKDKRAVIRKLSGWGEGRRLMQHLLTGSALREYAQLEEHESCRLLLSYLRHPERWYKHHFRYSTAILHRIVMGEKLTKTQKQLDEYQCVTNEFLFSLFRSGVDFFPEFAYLLPRRLQFWRPYWEKMGDFHKRVFQEWWDPVRKSVQEGTAEASFVRDALLNPESKYTGDDEDAMYLATSLTAAGGDNTRMTLNVFVMAALCEPEAFHQARAELDTTCGSDIETMRLPRVTDMESMPYMCAFIKEVLRWRPTVPLIPPHQLTEPQLEYEGYNFPKGTNFLVNNISVCYDCVDPGIFWPERWINGQGTESNVIHNFWGFGSGRRICVGYKIEQHILFVAISRLIYCFDYAENGPYCSTILNHWSMKEPFPVKVTLRSSAHGELILREASLNGLK